MGSRSIRRYSEGAFLLTCDTEAPVDVLQAIDQLGGPEIEAHCGETSVLVRFNPARTDPAELAAALSALDVDTANTPREHLRLRIRYDGPDLDAVAAASGLSTTEVIAVHSEATYRVALCGAFCPNSTPGGWHLLGTSNAELFNPNRNPPALLRPGTSITFEAVR